MVPCVLHFQLKDKEFVTCLIPEGLPAVHLRCMHRQGLLSLGSNTKALDLGSHLCIAVPKLGLRNMHTWVTGCLVLASKLRGLAPVMDRIWDATGAKRRLQLGVLCPQS